MQKPNIGKALVKIADRQQQSMQPARTKMEIYTVPKLHLQKVFRSLHPPKKTKMSLKIKRNLYLSNTIFFQAPFFRGHVSFRGSQLHLNGPPKKR